MEVTSPGGRTSSTSCDQSQSPRGAHFNARLSLDGGGDGGGSSRASSKSGGCGDKSRSRICSICRGETESFHLNYGASSCFSCRAFFRRLLQKHKGVPRENSYLCKQDGKCELTPENRAKCKKCRLKVIQKKTIHTF